MKHVFFINNLEDLNLKKDSSLFMCLSFKEAGLDTYVLFEKDLFITTSKTHTLSVYKISGTIKEDFYLSDVTIGEKLHLELDSNITLHMRIDPPFDMRYMRYLWMLNFLEEYYNVTVTNAPVGIMKNSEKIEAFKRPQTIKSFVGENSEAFIKFTQELVEEGYEDLILKPLDLFSGIGVEKHSLNSLNLKDIFKNKVISNEGAIVAQPFKKEVYNGEYRSLYYKGAEIGSILKTPPEGQYLTNIAQGASFHGVELPESIKTECDLVAAEMLKDGVDFIAFDILGESITEVNVTCPGLLVEVSNAFNKNLALLMI